MRRFQLHRAQSPPPGTKRQSRRSLLDAFPARAPPGPAMTRGFTADVSGIGPSGHGTQGKRGDRGDGYPGRPVSRPTAPSSVRRFRPRRPGARASSLVVTATSGPQKKRRQPCRLAAIPNRMARRRMKRRRQRVSQSGNSRGQANLDQSFPQESSARPADNRLIALRLAGWRHRAAAGAEARALPERIPYQRQLLHPLFRDVQTGHTQDWILPTRLPHERQLLPGQ